MVLRRLGATLPLHVFIRRAQVLKSYRDLLRAARSCQDSSLREDITRQIKDEYSRQKFVSDNLLIKSLLQDATRQLKTVKDLCQSLPQAMQPNSHDDTVYPSQRKKAAQEKHPGPSWLDSSEEGDQRGRVGEGWPWNS